MLKFKKLTLKDLNKIKTYTQKSPLKVCDFSIGVLLMWDKSFNYEYAEYNDTIIIKNHYGKEEWFLPPVGKDVDGATVQLEKYCVQKNVNLNYTCVDEGVLDFYKNRYNGRALIEYDRRWSDYIYDFTAIKTFVGKRYSGQRNHINKFKRLYPNYKYNQITRGDISMLKEFMKEYKKRHTDMGRIERKEYQNTITLLDNYSKKYFVGGYISVDKKIIAFSIGEYVGDTLVIHIEKALTQYQGVYPTMFNEFVSHSEKEGIIYINREDDSGDIGLRTSKTQYHPVMLANKNYVMVNKPMQIKRAPTLKGKGVYADKITQNDKENYYNLYINKSLNKYWGYDYRADIKTPSPDAFYNMVVADFKNKENMCLALRNEKGGQLIGEVVFYNFGYDNTVEIGVRLFRKYHGKGLGKQAFSLAIKYATQKLNKIPVAKAYKKNTPSINALFSAGFKKVSEDNKFIYFKSC